MILVLYVIGAIVFIISIIVGFSSGSFLGFLFGIAGGVSSAIIFFALAKIIENQDSILFKLINQEDSKKNLLQKKVCPSCNYKYDNDYNSCPHCGNRD